MKINLGCGSRIKPGMEWLNVDVMPLPGVDLVCDLDEPGAWPFDTAGAHLIEARDIFEHVTDAIKFMTECHRVLAPRGALHIHTPYYRSADAFTDPTHKRFPTEWTFDYWIPGTALYEAHNAAYGGVAYERIGMFLDGGSLDVTLLRA